MTMGRGTRIELVLEHESYTRSEIDGLMDALADWVHGKTCTADHSNPKASCSRDFFLSALVVDLEEEFPP